MTRTALFPTALLVAALPLTSASPARAQTEAELDAYWAALARTVQEGDFDGYAGAYHADAVLVSLSSGTSYPIAEALAGWKQGFDDTAAGRASAGVEFRFTQRLHDPVTAHETGMFRYFIQAPNHAPRVALLHFEALLVKKEGEWKMIMEYQKRPASEAEWEAAGASG